MKHVKNLIIGLICIGIIVFGCFNLYKLSTSKKDGKEKVSEAIEETTIFNESTEKNPSKEESQVASSEETEANTNPSTPTISKPSGCVAFNGSAYQTYPTVDEALDNVMGFPSTLSTGCDLTGFPNEGTTLIRMWIDYVSESYPPTIEVFLYSKNNWESSLDLSRFAGRTIVIGFSYQTNSIPPKVRYEYLALAIPKEQAKFESNSEEQGEAEIPESILESNTESETES